MSQLPDEPGPAAAPAVAQTPEQAQDQAQEQARAGTVQDRLLDAALACFRRLGSRRTRIEDIAAEAGLARTAVYRFYPNKTAIVAALATRWLAGDEAGLAAIARDSGRSPASRLQDFLLADAANTRRYLADSCLLEVLDEVIRSRQGILLQHRSHVRRHLAGLLAEGAGTGAFRPEPAEALARSIDDLMSQFHNPRLAADLQADQWRARAAAAADIVLRGVRAR